MVAAGRIARFTPAQGRLVSVALTVFGFPNPQLSLGTLRYGCPDFPPLLLAQKWPSLSHAVLLLYNTHSL